MDEMNIHVGGVAFPAGNTLAETTIYKLAEYIFSCVLLGNLTPGIMTQEMVTYGGGKD